MSAYSKLALLLAFCSLASALGISHQGVVSMDYMPGYNESFGYAAVNGDGNEEVAFARYVCGPLAKYVNLNPEAGEEVFVHENCNSVSSGVTTVANPYILSGGGIKYFSYTLSLPQTIPMGMKPGINQAFLGFIQVVAQTGSIGGRVAVQIPITVYVPYPGKYLEAKLTATNARKGEPVSFAARADNKGNETVSAVARITVYDSADKEITTVDAGSADIESRGSHEFTASLNTTDMEVASYTANVSIEYGGSSLAKAGAAFKVGELEARINKIETENAFEGKTAKVHVEAESMWGDEIPNVYSEVTVTRKGAASEGPFKTTSENLPAWGTATMTAYWDVSLAGEYEVKAVLYYAGKTAEKTESITIEAAPSTTPTAEATEVAPTAAPAGAESDVMPIVLGIVAICVLGALLYWLLSRKKPKEDFAISLSLSGTKLAVNIANATDKDGKAKGFVEILNQHGSAVATVPLPEAEVPAFGTKTVSVSLDSVPLEAGSYTLKVALGINGKKHEATQPLNVS